MSILTLVAQVLRAPESLAHATEEEFAARLPLLLAIVASGGAIFGAVVGSYRGELQLVYAAVKMPVLLLLPMLIVLPAVRALWQAYGVEVSARQMAMVSLVGAARTAVLAAATAPVIWLMFSVDMDYHQAVMLLAVTLGVVGLPGLSVLRHAVPTGQQPPWIALGAAVALLGLVTMQTGWLLRPFIARPMAEVAFLRPIEEDVFSSLGATADSARGDYSRTWEAQQSGFLSTREVQ